MREIGDCFSNEGSCDYSAGGSDNVEDFQNIGMRMEKAAGARPSTGGFVKIVNNVEKAPGIAAAEGPSTGGLVKKVEKAPDVPVAPGIPEQLGPSFPGNLEQLGSSFRRVNKVEKAPGIAAAGPSTGDVMERVEKTPSQRSVSVPSLSDLSDIPQFPPPPPRPREDTTLSPTTTIASVSSSSLQRVVRKDAAPAARRKQKNLVKSQSQFIPKTGNVLTAMGGPQGTKFTSSIKEVSNTTTTPSWDPYTSVDTTFAPATTASSWDPYTSVDTTFAPTTPEPKETNFVPRIDKDPITLGGAPSAGDYSDNNQPE